MEMELGIEEFVASSNNDATQIVIKGKRTKRHRQLSPCGVATMTYSSSSASEDHGGGGGADYGSFSSTTTAYESTEEEEDMANCLILLAQGGGETHKQAEDQGGRSEKSSSRKFAEMATASAAGKVGFYVYECKTCNRTFPSFQALGGHRASHKRPKTAVEEKKPSALPLRPPPSSSPQRINYDIEEAGQNQIKSTQISLQLGSNGGFSNKTKIHECSICRSEFSSGQALGGHMRRHRASTSGGAQGVRIGAAAIETSCHNAAASTVEAKPRNILQLDLNLPAPEDDLRESKFQFAATQKSLVMSAPALVDCHY